MSLKFKYILFVGFLHVALTVLFYYLLEDRKWYFILSELVVILSLLFSYLLYKSFIKPVALLQSGMDAIQDADFSIKYLKTGSKEIDNLVDVYNQMIDSLRIERTKLSEQSYFIKKLIEVTPVGIIIMDFDGMIANINLEAQKLLKVSDKSVGTNLFDKDTELINALKDVSIGESKILTVNGVDKYKCQVSEAIQQGFKRKFILLDDLSDELLQSEKDAYGSIIRMMAHEVNNSMGAINSILDSVIEFGFQNNEDKELAESLELAKERNNGLSKFMANYASILRLPEAHHEPMSLTKLLSRLSKLYFNVAEENSITIESFIPSHDINIVGDVVLLEQAISNMIKNSIESIGQNGKIKITCSENPTCFSISDNGKGIPSNVEDRLFTPFFSTKPTGQGVGLMLIKEILQSHKTQFSLKTDPITKWTEFKVVFQ